MDLAEATRTRDELQEKLDFVQLQLSEIDAQRAELAYAANTGDADAKRRIIALERNSG